METSFVIRYKFSSMIREVFFTSLDNDGFFCPSKLSVGKREVCIFCFRKQPDRVTRVSFSSGIAVQGIPVENERSLES